MNTSEKIHKLRRQIAECRKLAEQIEIDLAADITNGEMRQVINKLKEAKHWCGQALGAIGEKPPEGYPHDEPEE